MHFFYQLTIHFLALVGVLALIVLAGVHFLVKDEINDHEDEWPLDCGNYDSHTGNRAIEYGEPLADAAFVEDGGSLATSATKSLPPARVRPDSSAATAADGPLIIGFSKGEPVYATNGHATKTEPAQACAE